MAHKDFFSTMRPERKAGGFTRDDGTIAFYTRIHSLLSLEATVLDLGAGRGTIADDDVPLRAQLTNLRDSVKKIVGADVDPTYAEFMSPDGVAVGAGVLSNDVLKKCQCANTRRPRSCIPEVARENIESLVPANALPRETGPIAAEDANPARACRRVFILRDSLTVSVRLWQDRKRLKE